MPIEVIGPQLGTLRAAQLFDPKRERGGSALDEHICTGDDVEQHVEHTDHEGGLGELAAFRR
jgi:hypothetical protein